ncbi:hypothetical protein [uncultured Marinobacter sp.]|uniref:hypothetical protein n=1 Tax=uncultured Marinobacter sp. TaxID=187379 RepID=UPI0030DB8558
MFRKLCLVAGLTLSFSVAASNSAYVEQVDRPIKALSAQQIEGLEAGRGMGYALAAELNGYPGPLHVLELADELDLNPGQKARTQALFDEMNALTSQYGRELVEAERALDQAFAEKRITQDSLAAMLRRIEELQRSIRLEHLGTHLRQTELLTQAQIESYNRLRGYRSDDQDGQGNQGDNGHRHQHGGHHRH